MGKFLNAVGSLEIAGRVFTSKQKRRLTTVGLPTSKGLYMICQAPEGYFGEIPQYYIGNIVQIFSGLQTSKQISREVNYFNLDPSKMMIITDAGYIVLSPQRKGVSPGLIIVDLDSIRRLFDLNPGEKISGCGLSNSEDLPTRSDVLVFDTSADRRFFLTSNELAIYSYKFPEAIIAMDIKPYLTYLRHYIGIATSQEIHSRIEKGHSKYQYIMDDETPLEEGAALNREIIVIPFKVDTEEQAMIFSPTIDVSEDEIHEYLREKNQVEIDEYNTKFIKDSEKAFVSTHTPHYNDELFKSYPRSRDGLSDSSFRTVIYSLPNILTFVENIESYKNVISGKSYVTNKFIVVNFDTGECALTSDPEDYILDGILPSNKK